MKAQVAKYIGRRATGSWGRLGSEFEKRQAAKAVRRTIPIEVDETIDEPDCYHEVRRGIVLVNPWSNGRSFNPSDWHRGEGLMCSSKKVFLQECDKCIHCGKTWLD